MILENYLNSQNPKERLQAVQYIQQTKDPQYLRDITLLIRRETDPDVRQLANKTLTQLLEIKSAGGVIEPIQAPPEQTNDPLAGKINDLMDSTIQPIDTIISQEDAQASQTLDAVSEVLAEETTPTDEPSTKKKRPLLMLGIIASVVVNILLVVVVVMMLSNSQSTQTQSEDDDTVAQADDVATGEADDTVAVEDVASIVKTSAYFAQDYNTIYVVPLQESMLPTIETGISIELTGHCDLTTTLPRVYSVNEDDLMVFWFALDGTHCASYIRHEEGVYTELPIDGWSDISPGGPIDQPTDFNNDGYDDFLFVRANDSGAYSNSVLRVGYGNPDGTFDLGEEMPHEPNGWATRRSMGDFNDDGFMDYVYHTQEWGGPIPTTIQAWLGGDNGTFTQSDHLILEMPYTTSKPAIADFDNDGDADIFMPADDDVYNIGLSFMAFNNGDGTYTVLDSIDLAPLNNTEVRDQVNGFARPVDVNMDGNIDLHIRIINWLNNQNTYRIYLGNGDGTFEATGTSVEEGWWFPLAGQ